MRWPLHPVAFSLPYIDERCFFGDHNALRSCKRARAYAMLTLVKQARASELWVRRTQSMSHNCSTASSFRDRFHGFRFAQSVSHLSAAAKQPIRRRDGASFRRRARTISKSNPSLLAQRKVDASGLTSPLDDMERGILTEIVAGSSLKQIALKLGLQLRQVETQKASLMRKLKAASTADLVRVGIYAEL